MTHLRPVIGSSRKMVSVMVFGSMIAIAVCILSTRGVEAMVVATPASKTTTKSGLHTDMDNTAAAAAATSEHDSGDLLRMLLEGQNEITSNSNSRRVSSSSYSFDANAATTNGESKNNARKQRKTSPLLDEWRDYEALRETNLEDEILAPFFFESGWERRKIIANRFVQVLTTLNKAREDWTKSQQGVSADISQKEVRLEASGQDDPAAVRLCEAVASLGPLAVKLGQTLSQRPDIVGREACDALKRLQTKNTPFDDKLAYAVIRESLDYWDGPLAGNLGEEESTGDNSASFREKKPLFKSLSAEPIASASLGQVYKATTWEGVDIALKVQRPDALGTLCIDAQCFRIVFDVRKDWIGLGYQWTSFLNSVSGTVLEPEDHSPETGMTELEVRSRGGEGTVASVIDRVAKDVKREMDYRVEASNSYKFRDSLSFLGFVDTPDVLLATEKVLATKFINGHHLSSLNNPKHELAMTRMAVEACTASMVLTGFVHADPHEGNLMFREDDGRVVFLDFGLMSDVDQTVMEGFALGIQSLLSEDFVSLTEAFCQTDFITTPIMHRDRPEDLWKEDPKFGAEELAVDLEVAMRTTKGGMSQFGALATVLNQKISPNWLVFTPPYVLLLIRTFLTLEGIAGQVDPDFNIYEMSLPWVVRRSLSPVTEKGQKVLRNTILKEDNRIQWERVMELMAMQKAVGAAGEASGEDNDASAPSEESPAITTSTPTPTKEESSKNDSSTIAAAVTPEELERKQKEYADARNGAMKDAVGTILGSTNGKALRGVLKDLDTPDLIWKLGTKEGRPILKMGTEKVLNSLFGGKTKSEPSGEAESGPRSENYRPISDDCKQLREKQTRRTKQVTRFLIRRHLKKCLRQTKGILGITRLAASALQIAASLLVRRLLSSILQPTKRRQSPGKIAVEAVP